jgi:DNA-binding MarR family transcriptional regulator
MRGMNNRPATSGTCSSGRESAIPPPADTEPMRGRLVNARLLALLALIHKSGEIMYHRQTGMIELHQRTLLLIGHYGPLASFELGALTGREKAQISRAVRVLSEAGLIHRASLRARIALSETGRAACARLIAIARPRDDYLRRGISPDEIGRFVLLTRHLTEQAAWSLAQERQLTEEWTGAAPDDTPDETTFELPPRHERLHGQPQGDLPFSGMLAPQLHALTSYLKRSATLAYRRETGLSSFQWQVLSQAGEYDPVPLARLVSLVGRHKSQVGRAVKWLEAEGILQRRKLRGRRDILLQCSPKGAAMYAVMCESARLRDNALCAGITAEERAAYIATIEKLTANARALLAEAQHE